MGYAVLAARAALVAVFVVSLASKIRSRAAYEEFAASVVALGVAKGRWLTPAVAVATIAAEGTVALLLLPPSTMRFGFGGAAVLLTAFTVVIMVALHRDQQASCRCFGASAVPLGMLHVIRNLMLLTTAVTGLVGSLAGAESRLDAIGIVISLVAAAAAVLFVQRVDDLAVLIAGTRSTR